MSAAKLDPAFKAKWVAALRSGEFEQHRGSFISDDRSAFCCLGVAALLCGAKREEFYRSRAWTKFDELSNAALDAHPFAHMNDHEGKTFAEIADYIEANL